MHSLTEAVEINLAEGMIRAVQSDAIKSEQFENGHFS